MTNKKMYTNARDNGRFGRNLEVDARFMATPRTTVGGCQKQGRIDHRMKIDGNWVNIEVKSGCGTVTMPHELPIFDSYDLTDREALEAFILPTADYVVYSPNLDTTHIDAELDAFVFTRDEFLDMLFDYQKPMLKRNIKSGTYCLNIQTFKTSAKRTAHVMDYCLDKPMLTDWLASIGR